MNCQAFRKAWLDLDDTDSETLSHIETCEDCIVWIETQMTTEEEVQFLKEVPLPQANLEERIMQAIYETAGQNLPPHAATVSLQPPTSITSKRKTKGFPSFAWVSAAAVLLAVGFMGYQQLQTDQIQTASQIDNSPTTAANGAVSYHIVDQPASSAPASTPPEAAVERSAPPSEAPKLKQSTVQENTPIAKDTPPAAPAQAKIATSPLEGAIAMENQQSKAAPPETRATNKESRVTMVARNNGAEKPASEPKANSQSSTAVAPGDNSSAVATADANPSIAGSEQAFGITAATVPDSKQDVSTENALVGPPVPTAKQQITLSTFSDVDTAVQASDMPVPVLPTATNGFAMSDISIQYESETSTKVAHLAANYNRNKDWIKVEVLRNTQGKRSLSIPGTFSATQLFSINGEQAIAVSYEQHDKKDSAVQHAVHFNAQTNNQSVYVVITAHGVPLDELIDASKQITWKP
ncbi:hypothetical protein [uncultured Brevibacillus sp.]|uniref:hypothetical protein n=1 Tax=uncultured Brevibacillus sp. TaxID=169970 RepID=UPI0025955702|nr:hypothetical protein [uncultured Brevibacillus sp.]